MPGSRNRYDRRRVSETLRALAPLVSVALVFVGCSGEQSALDVAGRGARSIANLWWAMFWAGLVVYVVILALVGRVLWHRRARQASPEGPVERRLLIGGGIIVPAVILLAIFVLALFGMRDLSTLERDSGDPLVEVIGHMWWWEVRYPEHGVVTANEIHIPTGEPVELSVVAADVIHSIWVPRLNGKVDLLPGEANSLVLEAEEPGEYKGQCAEYCGLQHAHMKFLVVAQEPDEFETWLSARAEAPPPPTDSLARRGQQVFEGSACVYCHAVQGTNATGTLGPDLTGLMTRRTLAAGIMPNNRGNLAGWILDPQSAKPGNRMPPTNLDADDLEALIAYLETLE